MPWQKYRLIGCLNRAISKYRLDIDWSSHFLCLLRARLFLKCYDATPKRNALQKKGYEYFLREFILYIEANLNFIDILLPSF